MESFLQEILTVSKHLLLTVLAQNDRAETFIKCHTELRVTGYGIYSQRF